MLTIFIEPSVIRSLKKRGRTLSASSAPPSRWSTWHSCRISSTTRDYLALISSGSSSVRSSRRTSWLTRTSTAQIDSSAHCFAPYLCSCSGDGAPSALAATRCSARISTLISSIWMMHLPLTRCSRLRTRPNGTSKRWQISISNKLRNLKYSPTTRTMRRSRVPWCLVSPA